MKFIAYDFDGTIYDGDSSLDFYRFCFKKKKSISKYWFKQISFFCLYILGFKTKTQMKEVFFIFLKDFEKPEKIVEEFWETHIFKMKDWYIKKNHSKDIIISASPEFLLRIPAKKYKIKELIASPVDIKTGKFLGENCHGLEKVRRLREKYPDAEVEEMYTDSSVDLPMIEISKKGFMVLKNKIIPYFEYQPSTMRKLKRTFLSPTFIRFIFIGGINAFNGILFSYLYSLSIRNATLAFIIGYITSLIFSYLLNSFITFKDKKITMKKFLKFCISYIPNFLIQFFCVYILIDWLNIYKVVAYIISAVIGIPITYFLLLVFTFKK